MRRLRHCIIGDDYDETCEGKCPIASLCRKEKEKLEGTIE